jgi:cob(I)alamin adenosyltransferase
MIQIYTGQGKGKTTASLGLALRSLGAGKKVLLIQFLKDGRSSEIKAIKKIKNFAVKSFGKRGFVIKDHLTKRDFNLAKQGFNFAKKSIQGKKYDLIILDEINVAVDFGLLKKDDLLDLIRINPDKAELVLTGRGAKKEIIKQADLVTEMEEIKHYFRKNIKAREGIEY